MFILNVRKTYLRKEEPGAVAEFKFRHAEAREPALNANVRMLTYESEVFKTMQREGKHAFIERTPTTVTTFTIIED